MLHGSTRCTLARTLVFAAAITITPILAWCADVADKPSTGTTAKTAQTTQSASTQSKAEFEKLKGKWLRPDGGYVLQIKAFDETGKAEASYFNPNPIKISKAQASREDGAIKLFVELRDMGYPGCTYKLTYDAQTDQLKGVYYQAALQESYDIFFQRM